MPDYFPPHATAEREALQEYERQFAWSCQQLYMLNEKARESKKRYERAASKNYRSFRYRNRLRLSVVEGVRNVFLQFARDIADNISDLWWELYCEVVFIIDENNTIQLLYPAEMDDDNEFDIDSYVGYDDDDYSDGDNDDCDDDDDDDDVDSVADDEDIDDATEDDGQDDDIYSDEDDDDTIDNDNEENDWC